MQREIAFALAVFCLAVQLDSSALARAEHASARPRAAAKAVKIRTREGLASYYGPGLQGRRMANGQRLDMNAMIAAHPTYPLGTVVRVTNLKNKRSARLRIADRGPARAVRAEGVIIDVSLAAARALDFVEDGRTPVRVEVLKWGV